MTEAVQPVPTTSLGVVAHGAGDLRVEEVAVRVPALSEAVVRVAFGGVCGSDLHYWKTGAAGESVLRQPMLLGHEVVGTVVQAVTDGSGPAAGVKVAVHPGTPRGDGVTRYPADRPNLSPRGTYLGSAAHLPHTDGCFLRYATLPTRMLRALPEQVDLRAAALIEPASVAWHAVKQAGPVRGSTAMVVGVGPIGALIVAALRHAGAAEIVAVDLHPRALAIAQHVGATRVLLATEVDEVASVQADIVLESSGTPPGLSSALHGTARGGCVVLVGLQPTGNQPVPISLAITRELTLIGAFRFNNEIDEVIRALTDGLVVGPVITHEFDVSEAIKAFGVAADAEQSSKVLLRF